MKIITTDAPKEQSISDSFSVIADMEGHSKEKKFAYAIIFLIFLQIPILVWIFYVSAGCSFVPDVQGWSVAEGIQRCINSEARAESITVDDGKKTNTVGVVLTDQLSKEDQSAVAAYFSNNVEVTFAADGGLEGYITPQLLDVSGETFENRSYQFILVPIQNFKN